MVKRVVSFIFLAVVLLAIWSSWFAVHETQFAVVTRFGNPYRVIRESGLHAKWPAPVDKVVYLDRRLLVCDLPRPEEPAKEFLTLDKKNVEVAAYAAWRIKDPKRFLETIGTRKDAEALLSDVVISELGKVLASYDLKGLLSTDPNEMKLPEVMQRIRQTCAAELAKEDYGATVEIVDFRIKRLNFPEQNRNSVFERMRAERKSIATRYRSEGEKEATAIRAQADQKGTEILARAYREGQEIEGQADAEAARIYAEAYGQDTEFYEFLRTLESYEKSLKEGTTIFLPANSPYLKWLRAQTADSPGREPAR
jgi:membrane protease subunit HflC